MKNNLKIMIFHIRLVDWIYNKKLIIKFIMIVLLNKMIIAEITLVLFKMSLLVSIK